MFIKLLIQRGKESKLGTVGVPITRWNNINIGLGLQDLLYSHLLSIFFICRLWRVDAFLTALSNKGQI